MFYLNFRGGHFPNFNSEGHNIFYSSFFLFDRVCPLVLWIFDNFVCKKQVQYILNFFTKKKDRKTERQKDRKTERRRQKKTQRQNNIISIQIDNFFYTIDLLIKRKNERDRQKDRDNRKAKRQTERHSHKDTTKQSPSDKLLLYFDFRFLTIDILFSVSKTYFIRFLSFPNSSAKQQTKKVMN